MVWWQLQEHWGAWSTLSTYLTEFELIPIWQYIRNEFCFCSWGLDFKNEFHFRTSRRRNNFSKSWFWRRPHFFWDFLIKSLIKFFKIWKMAEIWKKGVKIIYPSGRIKPELNLTTTRGWGEPIKSKVLETYTSLNSFKVCQTIKEDQGRPMSPLLTISLPLMINEKSITPSVWIWKFELKLKFLINRNLIKD